MTLRDLKLINKYPRQWENRIRTQSRDIAGNGNACFVCAYSKHFEVCHLKPISAFPDEALISEINAKANLAILCRNCHWEQENGDLVVTKTLASVKGFEPPKPPDS